MTVYQRSPRRFPTGLAVIMVMMAVIAICFSIVMTRPAMYTNADGECVYVVVENPKNGIPQKGSCKSLTILERFIARQESAPRAH